MKKIYLIGISYVFLILCMTSCDAFKDGSAEVDLEGTWEYTFTDTDDGVTLSFHEVLNLESNNTFKAHLEFEALAPFKYKIGHVDYSGTWSVEDQKLLCEINKNSIDFTFGNLMDGEDRREFKDDLLSAWIENDYIDGGKILSISDEAFSLKDEHDGTLYHYERVK